MMIRTRRLALPALTVLLALPLLTGCVTTDEGRTVQPQIFDFERALRGGLYPVGFFHGLTLVVELDEADLPRNRDGELERRLLAVTPHPQPDGHEIFRISGHREIEYVNRRWRVGKFQYEEKTGVKSRLFVFKEHEGNFEFELHGQRILVEVEVKTRWIPSVMYWAEDVRRPTDVPNVYEAYTTETIQIGGAKIEIDGRTNIWRINDVVSYQYKKSPTLILEDVVR